MVFSPAVSQVIVEFLGTFIVALPAPLATNFVGPLAALPVGFMIASMVYSFLFISGAHFNPAITMAMLISGRMTFGTSMLYMFTQFMAAFFSALYAAYAIGVQIVAPQTTASLSAAWKAMTIEMIFTVAIVTAYMHCTCSKQRKNQFYGFAIGFASLAAILCVPGGYKGSAFNPAIATSLQLMRCATQGKCGDLLATAIHWIAPFLGSLLGTLMYGILDTEEKPHDPAAVVAGAGANAIADATGAAGVQSAAAAAGGAPVEMAMRADAGPGVAGAGAAGSKLQPGKTFY